MNNLDPKQLNKSQRLALLFGPGLFCLPVLVYGISSKYLPWGLHESYYLNAQLIAMAGLVFMSFSSKLDLKYLFLPSSQLIIMCSAIVIATTIVIVRANFSDSDAVDRNSMMRIAVFCIYLVAFDRYKAFGLRLVFSASRFLALLIIFVTALDFVLNPTIMPGGRYNWFWLHPNLGGEVLFVCIVVLIYCQRSFFNSIFILIAFVLIALLQSRAALLGSLLIISANEFFRFRQQTKSKKIYVLVLIAGVAIAGLLVSLLKPSWLPFDISQIVKVDLLQLDNEYRGLGTGLVGREGAFTQAFEKLSAYPIAGTGIGNSDPEFSQSVLRTIHNGFAKTIAELGLFSLVLFGLLTTTIYKTFRNDQLHLALIVACSFIFYFGARSINLNVFPMIFWILLLPWKPSLFNSEFGPTRRRVKRLRWH